MKAATFTLFIFFTLISTSLLAQKATSSTSEDSLSNNLSKSGTTIGGYGNAFYQYNSAQQTSKLTWSVLCCS